MPQQQRTHNLFVTTVGLAVITVFAAAMICEQPAPAVAACVFGLCVLVASLVWRFVRPVPADARCRCHDDDGPHGSGGGGGDNGILPFGGRRAG